MVKTLKASSTASPTSACSDEEDRGPKDADLPGRDWPRARALDAAVEIAIDDVVPRAAGAAHGEGADEEQGEVREARRRAMRGDRSKRRRPPARQQQQPGADRAVKARKAQIGTGPGRRDRIDPVAGRVGDRTGRPAHFASGLPLSVSKVPRPVFVFSAEFDRRGADGVAQRRRPRFRGRSLGADRGPELQGFFVVRLCACWTT